MKTRDNFGKGICNDCRRICASGLAGVALALSPAPQGDRRVQDVRDSDRRLQEFRTSHRPLNQSSSNDCVRAHKHSAESLHWVPTCQKSMRESFYFIKPISLSVSARPSLDGLAGYLTSLACTILRISIIFLQASAKP